MIRWTALALVGVVSACSWARFSDAEDNASVLLLTRPGSVRGFGSSLASAASDDRVLVMVAGAQGGPNGAAVFGIGQGQKPGLDALDANQCKTDCLVASRVVGLPRARSIDNEVRSNCWYSGWFTPAGGELSIWGACTEIAKQQLLTSLSVPVGVFSADPLNLATEAAPLGVQKADNGYKAPALLAAASGKAWAYGPLSLAFVELDPGEAHADLGAALAVTRAAGVRRYAVAAPSAGKVFLFEEDGTLAGCFSGAAGFGRSLAAGDVNGDGDDELLVADEANVSVVDGQLVSSVSAGTCASVPSSSVVVTLACDQTADISGCPGRFGESMAVGDIDGDGDGEVAVGAPGMSVRSEAQGGAVLVYDVEGERPERLTEARFVSSAVSGDRLGSSVLFVAQADRHVLLAGAPGGGKAAIFYCSKLLNASQRGSRCE